MTKHKPRMGPKGLKFDCKQLHEWYVTRGLSGAAIARLLGCDKSLVNRKLRSCGIARHPSLGADCDQLRVWYSEQKYSASRISALLKCSKPTVLKLLRKCGIPCNQMSDYDRDTYDWDSDELHRLYWEDGLSLEGIAEKKGCSSTAVADAFDRLGISTRPSNQKRIRWDDKQLRCWYWEEQRSTAWIASRCGCSETNVRVAMRRRGVPRRPPGRVAELTAEQKHERKQRYQRHYWQNVASQKTRDNKKLANRQFMKTYSKREDVKAQRNARHRQRMKNDPAYRIGFAIRGRLNKALERKAVGSTTQKLIGCDWAHLVWHLESQFTDGMTWVNRREWHIDHDFPLSAADVSDPIELRAVCNWRNLVPLWGPVNTSKHNKVFPEAQRLFNDLCEELRSPAHGGLPTPT